MTRLRLLSNVRFGYPVVALVVIVVLYASCIQLIRGLWHFFP